MVPTNKLLFPNPLSTRSIQNSLSLRNSSTEQAAVFKVKSTDPQKYLVSPPCGVIPVEGEATVTITHKKVAAEPDASDLEALSASQKFKISVVMVPRHLLDQSHQSLRSSLTSPTSSRSNQIESFTPRDIGRVSPSSPTSAAAALELWRQCQLLAVEFEQQLKCDFCCSEFIMSDEELATVCFDEGSGFVKAKDTIPAVKQASHGDSLAPNGESKTTVREIRSSTGGLQTNPMNKNSNEGEVHAKYELTEQAANPSDIAVPGPHPALVPVLVTALIGVCAVLTTVAIMRKR
eukprot:GILI01017952.1.p1 GENE.GILI01017952.1~~GILI01017952.1.p1  ORF type:complete len:330 (-),score=28.47 GILI01017952.1:122-994(-)